MQCASSMAKNEIFTDFKKSIFPDFDRDSGAKYKSLVLLFFTSTLTWSTSSVVSDEFKTCAILFSSEKPLTASTWFFIKAINGDITIAVPSNNNAGSW